LNGAFNILRGIPGVFMLGELNDLNQIFRALLQLFA
jgi:hypothetical protein